MVLRVVPATSLVIASLASIIEFNNVDLPTFGLPIMLANPLFMNTTSSTVILT